LVVLVGFVLLFFGFILLLFFTYNKLTTLEYSPSVISPVTLQDV
jgi:hypothetical protein